MLIELEMPETQPAPTSTQQQVEENEAPVKSTLLSEIFSLAKGFFVSNSSKDDSEDSKKIEEEQERHKEREMLKNRAWVFHIFYTVLGMISASVGEASWKKSLDLLNEAQESSDAATLVTFSYNKDFYLRFVGPSALTIIVIMFGISVILDVVCWKKR